MRPRTAPLDLAPQGNVDFIAARIRAGALRHLLTGDPAELPEGAPDAASIWGRRTDDLADALAETDSLTDRTRILARWLRSRLSPASTGRADAAIDRSIERIYRDPAAGLDSAIGLSSLGVRQFERRFKHAAALSPKRFQRLARMYKLVRFETLRPSESYLLRALDLGYFDQAHVIHEFRELAGQPPLSLLAEIATRTHFYNSPRPGAGSFQA